MIDKTLLAFFRRRAAVDRMMRAMPKSALDSRTQVILELDARERRATKVLAAVLDDPMFVNHRTVTGRCVVHIKDGMV